MPPLSLFVEAYPVLALVISGIFGLMVGSFLNVVIYRLPAMIDKDWKAQCRQLLGNEEPADDGEEPFDLVRPRSRCPHCGHPISALENIPIVSYLIQKGRCKGCHEPISLRYPLVEGLCALLTVLVFWRLGFSWPGLAAVLLTWALIALTFIDIDHQLLPDNITLPFLWLGLILNTFGLFTDLQSAVLGAAAGYGFLWIVYQLFRLLTGKEGMGFGDFKLFALFGAWLGWQQLPLIILLASFVGAAGGIANIVFRGHDRNRPIPFGPYLCVAGWVALLWGDTLTRAYLQFARLA